MKRTLYVCDVCRAEIQRGERPGGDNGVALVVWEDLDDSGEGRVRHAHLGCLPKELRPKR